MEEKGSLSINSENMFPIIKKWLYSDHDIFYREIISNGCDAITKRNKLFMMGEEEMPKDYKARIDVVLDPDNKTIEVTDNGLGMTADEVKEYINNIAFSGAQAFLEKYKDKANNDQIIGHFGLGFYSAFMVSELVEIDTLSWQKDAKAVHWTCDGSSSFTMTDSDRKEIGTTITMHLTDDCVEFCNYYRAKEVIQKYCGFMPTEIWLSVKNTKETETIKESERRPDDVVIEEIQPKEDESKKDDKDKKDEKPKEKELKIRKRPELVNDPNPLWMKTPKDCTDEEYKEFYRKVFNDYKEPLFWIHLNMDYPFNLKGILYFPKINLEYESAEGVIKLYNNQVFIADNIKEVIPEYLMVLKGVIDCPDLPLNVSRSALQNDGFAQKISEYITKKVAEKLAGLCKTERDKYEKYWDDISPFIKYGYLKDEKFAEKIKDYILFKDLDGKYHALPEALDINEAKEEEKKEGEEKSEEKPEEKSEEKKDSESSTDKKEEEKKEPKTIYYTDDPVQQGQYIRMFREQGMQAFVLAEQIDQPFIQQIEAKDQNIQFRRVDAAVDDLLKSETDRKDAESLKDEAKKLEKVFHKALNDDKIKVSVEKLKDKNVASMLTVDEQNRRFQDMMKMYSNGSTGMYAEYGKEGETLVLNADHPLVQYLTEHRRAKNAGTIAKQLYDLAKIQNQTLSAEEMTAFVRRSNEILMTLANRHVDEEDLPEEKDAKDASSDAESASSDKKEDAKADASNDDQQIEKVEAEEMPAEDAAAPDPEKDQAAETVESEEEEKKD